MVEFGNARYQDLLDCYLAGEEVPVAELQQVWRNHTCPGPWTSSAYPKYFAAFREANKSLPAERRLRVHLGDPPINWSAIRNRQEFGEFLEVRDTHFAKVVEEKVLAKGRNVLLLIGGLHLTRKEAQPLPGVMHFKKAPAGSTDTEGPEGKISLPPPGGGGPPGKFRRPDPNNVAILLEKSHPGKTLVILVHDGHGEGSAELDTRVASWSNPSLAMVKGTWLGAWKAHRLLPGGKGMKFIRDGKEIEVPRPDPDRGPALEEVADAWLFLGPLGSLTRAANDDPAKDVSFQEELKRRSSVSGSLSASPPKK